jgi:NADH:ubiquinone oxidoreductase subunit B-like Fe-S oxidoreductase
VAIGACGLTGGVFRDAYNVVGGVDKVIPVDVYVPGCPAKPEAIIDGLVLALGKLGSGDTASARAAAEAIKGLPVESAGRPEEHS